MRSREGCRQGGKREGEREWGKGKDRDREADIRIKRRVFFLINCQMMKKKMENQPERSLPSSYLAIKTLLAMGRQAGRQAPASQESPKVLMECLVKWSGDLGRGTPPSIVCTGKPQIHRGQLEPDTGTEKEW